jgi:hypothetical protein
MKQMTSSRFVAANIQPLRTCGVSVAGAKDIVVGASLRDQGHIGEVRGHVHPSGATMRQFFDAWRQPDSSCGVFHASGPLKARCKSLSIVYKPGSLA